MFESTPHSDAPQQHDAEGYGEADCSAITKAIILGAGYGTRLKPLTDQTPKILVPVLEKPFLARLLRRLQHSEVSEIALNTHYLSTQVNTWLSAHQKQAQSTQDHSWPTVTTFEEETLLGTGGALHNMRQWWGAHPVLVWNADIVAELSLQQLSQFALQHKGVGTLVVQSRAADSQLLLDTATQRIVGIFSDRRQLHKQIQPAEGAVQKVAYNGVGCFFSALQPYLPADGDLIDALLSAMQNGEVLYGWDMQNGFFGTSGSLEKLAALNKGLQSRQDLLTIWGGESRL